VVDPGASRLPPIESRVGYPRHDGSRSIIDYVSASRTRVVLADDDVLLREGLARLLEQSGYDVAGQAGTARELVELVREVSPELVVADIRMPPTYTNEGLDAANSIRHEVPDIAVVVLTAHVQVEPATALLVSGRRSGYLLKTRVTDVDDFLQALERIVQGDSVVDPALVQELVAARHARDPLDVLSPRELEVLALMAEGRSNSAIARALAVSGGAVEKHINNIFAKLGLAPAEGDHRRVLAVLRYVNGNQT
jgi:DNA-binding NarL/FixJ family response regulator